MKSDIKLGQIEAARDFVSNISVQDEDSLHKKEIALDCINEVLETLRPVTWLDEEKLAMRKLASIVAGYLRAIVDGKATINEWRKFCLNMKKGI
jgi:hypothetical protein